MSVVYALVICFRTASSAVPVLRYVWIRVPIHYVTLRALFVDCITIAMYLYIKCQCLLGLVWYDEYNDRCEAHGEESDLKQLKVSIFVVNTDVEVLFDVTVD